MRMHTRLFAIGAVVAFSYCIQSFFPVVTFPELRGPYQTVGVQTLYLYSNRSSSSHEKPLLIHAYYPSSIKRPLAEQEGAPFMSARVADALALFAGLPAFLFQSLSFARIRAIHGVPIVTVTRNNDKLPLILFSHGIGGTATLYASQLTELASHGFVVLAPIHNDGSSCLSEMPTSPNGDIPFRYIEGVPLFSSGERDMRVAQIQQRTAELRRVIEMIDKDEHLWSVQPTFIGRIDSKKLVVAGHSFGATTAYHFAASVTDIPVMAVITHDLCVEPLQGQTPPTTDTPLITTPLLATQSVEWSEWKENDIQVKKLVKASLHSESTLTTIAGTRHSNYVDVALFSPWFARWLRAIGPADFVKTMNTINDLQVSFLRTAIIMNDEPKQ